ncbi:MAG TPA: response regulator [Candidatus Acidoferrales bacterium]|jgi:HD-like signal output (HDOD) protein|nr:response regulator [Candidatus Acidoferrales bacterium]
MKTRILFVDDEELALRGLNRLLYSMRDEWEMEFLDGGEKALNRMAIAPFDVVVSDMRMPGMNGAEFLNEVMKRYPKTVRLILSGYADRDLILKCVGSTHQYLAKPCDADALKMTVRRAAELERTMKTEALRQLVTRCVELPSVPAVFSEMVEALQDPETDVETIGKIVVKDGAMTAKILKLVNSAFFGLGHKIADPNEAVAYLGTDTIKSLVLFANAFAEYERVKLDGFSIEALYAHSLIAARAAKMVALQQNAERKLADESYVAGLLHDVGKLVFAANLTEDYQRILNLAHEKKIPLAAAEREIFGADHADIGGYLLGLWGLPVPVVEAIALHHKPRSAAQKTFSPLTAVHIGNVIASAEKSSIPGLPAGKFDLEYLSSLKIHASLDIWKKEWQSYCAENDASQTG